MGVKNRHRVRDKDLESYVAPLRDLYGMRPFEDPVESGDTDHGDVLLSGSTVVAVRLGDRFYPTVKGMLQTRPTRRWVTVDMGAVPHVTNGADVMAPGIVDADPDIEEGDPVWIRDVDNDQPLAVGDALADAEAMVQGDQGKVVRNLHYVGDEIFELAV